MCGLIMFLEKVCAEFSERVLCLYVHKTRFSCDFEEAVIKYAQPLLFTIGFTLIIAGTVNLSFSQYDPEKTQAQNPETASAQNPEGVCCVLPFAEQTIHLPAQPAITIVSAEQSPTVVGAEQAPLLDAEVARDIAAEIANPLAAELANAGDAEIAAAQEAEALDPNYDDSLFRFSAGNLLAFLEGAFGALVMVGAGLGAIIAAAFGAYKASIALLFVAVGAFILRALVSLFFGTNYPTYGVGEFVGGDNGN